VGHDASSAFVALEDALGDDVLLADSLDGNPLSAGTRLGSCAGRTGSSLR
jgi:hypothetical protein